MVFRVVKLFIQCFVGFVFVACTNGCAPTSMGFSSPTPRLTAVQATPGAEVTRPLTATLATNLVGAIRSDPAAYTGKQVEIVGFYRGWDLLKEAAGGPPVTRSDWVITDRGGAIYVTGAAPDGLDPSSSQETNKLVRLVAAVEQNQNGAYLRGISAEIISSP